VHFESHVRSAWVWALAAGLTALMVAVLWTSPEGPPPSRETPVGTAGRVTAGEPDESPATLHDLETMAGALDQHELLGWHVDFHVKVSAIRDATSFWIGKADSRVLVVSMTPVSADQFVRITGTIEAQDQQVYIRAGSVTPE